MGGWWSVLVQVMGKRLWIFGGSPDTPAAWSDDGVQWYPLPSTMLNDDATSRVGVLVLVRGCSLFLSSLVCARTHRHFRTLSTPSPFSGIRLLCLLMSVDVL